MLPYSTTLDWYHANFYVSQIAANRILAILDAHKPELHFVKCGAHAGASDPLLDKFIRERNWRGILIEPVPYLMARLQNHYKDVDGLMLIQAACCLTDGSRKFNVVDEQAEQVSLLSSFLSSFDRGVILRHECLIPGLTTHIQEIDVQTMRLDTVIEKAGLASVDLVISDCEGGDHEAIMSLDLQKFAPSVVIYEHKHLHPDNLRVLREHMEANGFRAIGLFEDTIWVRGPLADHEELRRMASGFGTLYQPQA